MTTPDDDVLAEVLIGDREAILDTWTEALLTSPHDHYHRRAPTEVRSRLTESLDAVI